MGSETVSLESLCELIVDCPHSTPEWTDSGVIVLRNQNIRDGVLDLSNPSYTKESDYQFRIKRATPQAGDIVITREAPMGEVCLIPKGLKCCLGQRQVLLRAKKNVSNEYLFWALQSPFVQNQIAWNEGTGTTVSNVRIPVLKALQIPRHIGEETKIGSALSAIANKITLNRQLNQTLEHMAQALFKSWFVDFDPVIDNALAAGNPIPDDLQDRAERRQQQINKPDHKPLPDNIRTLFPSEFELTESLGWVPRGWGEGTLADVASYATEKIDTAELSLENYISTENMNAEKSGICSAASLPSSDQVSKFINGQTLISNIRPYFKKIWLASFSGGRSADVLCFQAKNKGTNEYLFNLLYQDTFFDYMMATSKGTKMPRGDKGAIMSWPALKPSPKLMEEFSNTVKPFYSANQLRSNQSNTLSEARDTLLPKLISGELRIPEAESALTLALSQRERGLESASE